MISTVVVSRFEDSFSPFGKLLAKAASSPRSRFVLAVGSAVFDAMFNGGMATTSTEIELPDVEPAAFLALLK